MKIPTWLKTIISFALAVLLIYWSVGSITAQERQVIVEAMGKTSWIWIFLSMFLSLLSHASRALRWQQMLQTFNPVRLMYIFYAQGIGNLVNMALPRIGEATKVGLVSRTEKISFDKVVGTAVNDRIIDVFFLLAVTAAAVLLQYPIIGNYTSSIWTAITQKFAQLNYLLLIGLGLSVLLIVWLLATKFQFIWQKILTILSNIGQGIAALWRVEKKGVFIFHSLFIWIMYYLMIYVCTKSMNFTSDLSPLAGLVLLAFGSWGFLITPGGIGAYPIVIANILVLYGKDYNLGIAFGWVIWFGQSLLNLLIGGISLVFLGIKNTPINNKNVI